MKWETIKMGELFKIKHGWAFKGEFFSSAGELIIVTPGNFLEAGGFRQVAGKEKFYLGEFPIDFLLKKGQVIIAMTEQGPGLLGSPALVPEDDNYLHNQRIGLIHEINDDKIDPMYIYRLFFTSNVRNEIFGSATGTKVKHTAPKRIYDIEVQVPPLPTQRKIASILSAYDNLIENNLKRIKLLEEKAFASYKILMNTESLVEGKTGDLADVKSGFAFKGSDWTDVGFPVIKIKNIVNNDIDLMNCSLIPENVAKAAIKFELNAGDLLIAMTGATVGKIGMMPRTETSFYLNQRVGIFKPKIENAELFLFCFYNEPSAKVAVESLASGAAQPNISGGQIESIKLLYPKLDTIVEFGNDLKKHFELIWNLKQQNAKLREARDILLPRLMSGLIEI